MSTGKFLLGILMISSVLASSNFFAEGSDTGILARPAFYEAGSGVLVPGISFEDGFSGGYFTANLGQLNNEDIMLYSPGGGIGFSASGVKLELREPGVGSDIAPDRSYEDLFYPAFGGPVAPEIAYLELTFPGSSYVQPVGIEKLDHYYNFFYGSDPEGWYTHVPGYREVMFVDIYDDIDLRYYYNGNNLKYDFIVHPGGEPGDIRVRVEGADRIGLTGAGDVVMEAGLGSVADSELFVYQAVGPGLRPVETRFRLIDENTYGFAVEGEYDARIDLVIDPDLVSTFIGGSAEDIARDIVMDETNNNFIATGSTLSTDFPIKNGYSSTNKGSRDVFVSKLTSDCKSLLYSTYIGGTLDDNGVGVTVDAAGDIYVVGDTYSNNFPTTSGAADTGHNGGIDGFILKLVKNGDSLVYSTFVGGSSYDYGLELALDSEKRVYMTGFTISSDFPTSSEAYQTSIGGTYDGIVTCLAADGKSFKGSTYLGGQTNDIFNAITLDHDGDVWLVGDTYSSNFPTTEGVYSTTLSGSNDGVICEFDSDLKTLSRSTYFGGSLFDYCRDIVVLEEGFVYICGDTYSSDFPVTDDAYDKTHDSVYDAFVVKIKDDLKTLSYSTYFGGNDREYAHGLAVDAQKNLYFTGATYSSDLNVTADAYDPTYNGNSDCFLAVLNYGNSELVYSSYFGGGNDDLAASLVFDDNGKLFVTGRCRQGFPAIGSGYSTTHGGDQDAFVVAIAFYYPPAVADLTFSSQELYRPGTIELYANGSDVEDPESELEPIFECMAPLEDWSTAGFGTAVYASERWQTAYSIPLDAVPGKYSFRVAFRDTNNKWSNWFLPDKTVEVMNNPPLIEDLTLSSYTVFKGDELTVRLVGADVENEQEDLNLTLWIKQSSMEHWEPLEVDGFEFDLDAWKYGLMIGPEWDYGYYDLRAGASDLDLDPGPWTYLNGSLQVRARSPEITSFELSKTSVYRKEMVDIYITCKDLDTNLELLGVEVQYRSPDDDNWRDMTVDHLGSYWSTALTTRLDWQVGMYDFRARVTDYFCPESTWSYYNDSLEVLNNPPEVFGFEISDDMAIRGETVTISIGARDLENDADDLKIELGYRLKEQEQWWDDIIPYPEFSNGLWHYEVTLPDGASLGTYSFRMRAQDLGGTWSEYEHQFNALEVYNSQPVVTGLTPGQLEVFRTETVYLTAAGSDLEDGPGELQCRIYYRIYDGMGWQELGTVYDPENMIWTAELETGIDTALNRYSFMAVIIDSDGLQSNPVFTNNSIIILNNPPRILDTLDDIKVGTEPVVVELVNYGYDIESPEIDLSWAVDMASIKNNMLHINTDSLDRGKLVIYPGQGESGSDDITLILTDPQGGYYIKRDVTIILTGQALPDDDMDDDIDSDTPVKDLDKSDSLVYFYLLIVITVVILVAILGLFLHRRKRGARQDKKLLEVQGPVDPGLAAAKTIGLRSRAVAAVSAPEQKLQLEPQARARPAELATPTPRPMLPPAGVEQSHAPAPRTPTPQPVPQPAPGPGPRPEPAGPAPETTTVVVNDKNSTPLSISIPYIPVKED